MSIQRRRTTNYLPRYRTSTRNYSLFNVNQKANFALEKIGLLQASLNVEYKRHDASFSGNITNAGSVVILTGIGQGDQNTQRDGNQVKMVSIQMKGTSIGGASTADDCLVRFMLVLDNNSQAGTPAIGDILDSITVNSFRNINNKNRFVILRDFVFSQAGNQDVPKYHEFYLKKRLTINFDGINSTDLAGNHLYMVLFSNQGANYPVGNYKFRTRFLDN